MIETIKPATKWNLDGGVLCLDFINTIPDRNFCETHDHLTNFIKILDWCIAMKLIDKNEFDKLSTKAAGEPDKSMAAFKKYIDSRENLWTIFSAIAGGKAPAEKDSNLFSKNLSAMLAKLKFEFTQNSYKLVLTKKKEDFFAPLDVILKSAFDLLTKEQKNRIKDCSQCGVLFLDVSKNNTRQWCNPSSCGTIIRSRRYKKKKRESIKS